MPHVHRNPFSRRLSNTILTSTACLELPLIPPPNEIRRAKSRQAMTGVGGEPDAYLEADLANHPEAH